MRFGEIEGSEFKLLRLESVSTGEICTDNYAYDTKLLETFPSTFERRNWNKVDTILSRRI